MRVTVPKGGLPPRFRRVMNLAHFLLQSAKRYPSEVALVSGEDTLTWAQLNARVDAMAAALAARGVSKGDRILVQAKNSNQLFETMFVSEFPDHARAATDAAPALGFTVSIGASAFGQDYDALVAEYRGRAAPPAEVEHDDPCWFFFTSGTTGRPKAAVLTHGQLTAH